MWSWLDIHMRSVEQEAESVRQCVFCKIEARTIGKVSAASRVTAMVTPPRIVKAGARTPCLAVTCWLRVRTDAGVMALAAAQIHTLGVYQLNAIASHKQTYPSAKAILKTVRSSVAQTFPLTTACLCWRWLDLPLSNRPAPCTDLEKRMGSKKPVTIARRPIMFPSEKPSASQARVEQGLGRCCPIFASLTFRLQKRPMHSLHPKCLHFHLHRSPQCHKILKRVFSVTGP
jgi:hypothetical protein